MKQPLQTTGKAAVQMFDSVNPDLMLLDIMLPELDGWQVCREIRKKSQCPIIMLTAKGEVFDKVLGADDYVVKPLRDKRGHRAHQRRPPPPHWQKKESSQVKAVHYENLLHQPLPNYEQGHGRSD